MTTGSVAVIFIKLSLLKVDSVDRVSVLEANSVAAGFGGSNLEQPIIRRSGLAVAVGSDNVVSAIVVRVSLLVRAEYVKDDSLQKVKV